MQFLLQSCSGFEFGRTAEARLGAELAGGRTVLRHQHVGYPFHITRAFYLDQMRPELATLYLQSASGGLYAADRLQFELTVGACAALHVTTQASTIVHDARTGGSMMRHVVSVEDGAFCAIVSDPYVLFPGAELYLETLASVAPTATLIMAEGFATHDPHRAGRIFQRFSTNTRILRKDGKLLVCDRGSVSGQELSASCGALGGMRATGSLLIITPPDQLAEIPEIEAAVDACGCVAGVTSAPNGAGIAMRVLAPDGGALVRGIEAAFHIGARAALGVDLTPRRK